MRRRDISQVEPSVIGAVLKAWIVLVIVMFVWVGWIYLRGRRNRRGASDKRVGRGERPADNALQRRRRRGR